MGKPRTTAVTQPTDALLVLAVASMLGGGLLLMGWGLWPVAAG